MDNHDEESRRPPMHKPIVTQDGRISVLLLLKGEFKEHFSDWMRSWIAEHGYETAPARSIDTKQAVKSLGDPFGVSQGPFFDGA